MLSLISVAADEWPILYVLALFDEPSAQARLLTILHARGQKTSQGRGFDTALLKATLSGLEKRKLVVFKHGIGYRLASDVRMDVLWHLHETGWLKSWIGTMRAELESERKQGYGRVSSSTACRRELLFAALLHKGDEVRQWHELFLKTSEGHADHLGTEFFAGENGIRLFATLARDDQALLLQNILYAACWYLHDVRAAFEYGVAHAAELITTRNTLAIYLHTQACLRGDAVAQARLEGLTEDAILRSAIATTKAGIQGDYAAAIAHAEMWSKLYKAATGKRKVFVPELMGLLYTVALLGQGDAVSLKRAKEQIDEGVKLREAYAYTLLQQLVNHFVSGTPVSSTLSSQMPRLANDIDAVFEALAHYWCDLPQRPTALEKLLKMRDSMHYAGYVWVAAELDVVLQRHYDKPQDKYKNWHQQRQLKPLVLAVRKEESWQRALTALAQLRPQAAQLPQTKNDARIAWLVTLHHGDVHLEPREQKQSAKGVWSKGRPVGLKRLAQEQETLPMMNEQDKRAATCVRKNYATYYGGSEYELPGELALPHLVSHPAVYWADAPDVRIDIAKGEIALQLKEKNEQISLQLDPPMGDAKFYCRKETPTRLVIFSTNSEIKQIAGIVGTGLTVPASAKAQLVDVIAAIAPHLAIHSDVPELTAHLTTVPADMTLYAHLLPLQEGLRLQFLMRPMKDGSWYAPGQGSANVLGEQDGATVQASRDLKAEKASLNALIKASPALLTAEENGNEWQLMHPEHCLELLSELKAQAEDILQLVWPEGERFRLKGTRSLQQMRLSIKRQGEWFVAGGEITLDDGRVLALRELLQMTEGASSRFLKIGDNDYLALTDSFRKRLDELRAFGDFSGKEGVRINPLAAPALAELADEVGELKADSAWRDQVSKLDSLADFVPVLPTTLQAELRDYQLDGYQWLARLAQWGVGACLADDMGLGKTVQALALLLDRAPNGPALVVAPISVAMNWQSEVARFAPTMKVRAYHNNRSLADLGAFDIVIASYGMLQSDTEAFSAQHWHTVVLDEAQVIKNAATKRSQAAMALTADFKMIASGTPVENHLGELWNLFRFINPGLLGSKERFAERFSNPIERGDKPARQHLKKLIQPFILRRTKTQVLSELPSRTEITLQVTLSDEERHLYEALRQEAVDKINQLKPGDSKAMQVLAEITKLRRFCCNPKLVLKNASVAGSKLGVFAETIEELLDNKHKALVFSQFVDHLSIVRAWLDEKGISYQYLDGSTPPIERKKRVDAFQAGQGDIFLISLKAGGSGLNLTAADYVIHLDPWWNPAVEDQASDRAHRMGQTRPVTIYRLVAQDTIEEKILALHAEKRDLADSLLDGGDASGKMDTAALLRLLKESV